VRGRILVVGVDSGRLIGVAAFAALLLTGLSGCAATPAAAPPPAPVPIAVEPPPPPPEPKDQQASQDMQDWNLFPDPTSGNVDVYYKGKYMGAVTGNEPASEDPPLPHPVPGGGPDQ
jgi:hypothetical protein